MVAGALIRCAAQRGQVLHATGAGVSGEAPAGDPAGAYGRHPGAAGISGQVQHAPQDESDRLNACYLLACDRDALSSPTSTGIRPNQLVSCESCGLLPIANHERTSDERLANGEPTMDDSQRFAICFGRYATPLLRAPIDEPFAAGAVSVTTATAARRGRRPLCGLGPRLECGRSRRGVPP